jgi:hypothetical protein
VSNKKPVYPENFSTPIMCRFAERCPMFPLMSGRPALQFYQINYCESDFSTCARYQQASQGEMPDPHLLPDGKWLPEDESEPRPSVEADSNAEQD